MSYPYTNFGFKLWRLRESRGKTTQEMAKYLEKYISAKEYKKYEHGQIIPNDQILLEISRVLKTDITRLKQWAAYGGRKKDSAKVSEGAMAYEELMEQAIQRVKDTHKETTGHNLNQEQILALNKLKRHSLRIVDLPVLPMNFILIVDTITSSEVISKHSKIEYLHQINDFITEGESLAGFISRDMYYGSIIFYLANLLFFYDRPFKNIEECMNQLTIAQFTELFLLATHETRIYKLENDIPKLQQNFDFSSMSCLFIRSLKRELKNDLPKNIDFDHLYQACLLQGIGQYILFERLKPSLAGTSGDILDKDVSEDHIQPALGNKLFSQVVWEMHPVVSAIYGANLNFPKEVLDIVATHHDHPVNQVSPTCAMLKMVNFFVDSDFPELSKKQFEELLQAYPQVKIPVEPFYQVCSKLSKLKHHLYERSSSLLEQSSKEVADYTNQRIEKMAALNTKSDDMVYDGLMSVPLKRSEFRFDQGFQLVLKNVAHTRFENLLLGFFSPRFEEPICNLGERIENFYLRYKYALSKDLSDVSEVYKLSVEEVRVRLGLKK